jgi:hypothetical protein
MVEQFLLPISVKVEQIRREIKRRGRVKAGSKPVRSTQQSPAIFRLPDHHPAYLVLITDVADERQPLIGAGGGETASDEVSDPVSGVPPPQDGIHDLLFVGERRGGNKGLRNDCGKKIRRGNKR